MLTLLVVITSSVCAQNQNDEQSASIQSISHVTQNNDIVEHPANSSIELDFSLATGESWNTKDMPNNMLENCINGSIITGFETNNIVIQTQGRSYFSEAIIYFSDSDRGSNGIELTVGANNNSSGVSSFSTTSILDITDLGIPDVESLNDNTFYLQFYETTDDILNAIDARYTSGKLKVWGVDLEVAPNCPFVQEVANADIAVTFSADNNETLAIGDNLAFEIIGTNTHDNSATNVTVINTISESLKFIDLSCDTGFTTADASVAKSISIGEVLANSSFTCTINTEVLSFENINATVNVTLDNDNDLSNNSTTLVVMATIQSVPLNNLLTLSVLFFLLIFSGLYQKKIIYKK